MGDLVAAGAGLLLFISLFLEWYNVSAKNAFVDISQGASGWEALGPGDIFLLIVAGVAIAVAAMRALNVLPKGLPVSPGLVVLVLGALAVLFTLFRIIDIPGEGTDVPGVDIGRSFGVFVAFLASAGVAVGGWLGWNEEGKPTPGGAGAPGIGGPTASPFGPSQPAGGQPVAQPQQPAAATPAAGAPAAAAQPAGGAAAKADWYPDPRGEKRLRYWDGSQWTDHTAD
jgi:hypothetical protein